MDFFSTISYNFYIKIKENAMALTTQQKVNEYFGVLVEKYKYIPEVKAIYIDEYLDEKNITILLSINQYDDKLMEDLIQKELDISKIFSDVVATYNYIPDLIDNKESIIGEKAKLIFER